MGDSMQGVLAGRPASQVEDISIIEGGGAGVLAFRADGRAVATGEPVVAAGTSPRRRVLQVKLLLLTVDLAAVALAMAAASSLREVMPREEIQATTRQLRVAVLSLPLWAAFLVHYRLYDSRNVSSRLLEFRSVVHAAGATVMTIAGVAFLAEVYVPRSWLVLTFLLSVVTLTASHDLARRTFDARRRQGRLQRPVIIVGANAEGREVAAMLAQGPVPTYRVVGFVDDDLPAGAVVDGLTVLGGVDEVAAVARDRQVGGVLIATTSIGLQRSSKLAFDLTAAHVHVELCSGLCDVAAERLRVARVGRLAMLYVEPVRLGGWRGLAKRGFDLAAASVLLLVAAPILAVAAVAIKLDSPGPVHFRQERLGRDGRRFAIVKLRTMVQQAEAMVVDLRSQNEADGPLFKIADDPRITRVGRFLRKMSIDELPQLWNVVRGEMSLVGPRPAIPAEAAGWSPELHERLRVRPGITGMWQVSGRSNASFDDYTRLDLYYVHNWSLLTDLAMLAKTVPTVISRRGAS